MAPYGGVMDHAPGFLKLVNEVRPKVKEVTVEQAKPPSRSRIGRAVMVSQHESLRRAVIGERAHIVLRGADRLVRRSVGIGALAPALHEKRLPEHITSGLAVFMNQSRMRPGCSPSALIMYCGGGYRSVLTVDVAQRMGYRNVASVIGGYKALVQEQWVMKKEN